MQHQSARPRGRRSYTARCATCASLFDKEDYRAQSPCRIRNSGHRADTPTITRRRSMRNPALALASLLIGGSLPGLLHGQAPDSSKDGSVLTPGDSVWIMVWRKPEFTGEFAVAADGSISHPLYRAVMVGGVPLATAEANLRSLLEKFDREPQFVMVPLFRVAVEGEVNRPSMYALSPKTTISEAVARAGGPTQFGRLDRVRLLRSGAKDRKSTRLNSSHLVISYAVFCLKKKKNKKTQHRGGDTPDL